MSIIQRAKTIGGFYKTALLRRFIPHYRQSNDFSSEIGHWKRVLSSLSTFPEDVRSDFENRMNPDRLLQEPLATLIQSLPKPWRILDVGCGPLSTIGLRVEAESVELFGADPLADTYLSQLVEVGVAPNCKLIQTDCLDLMERFSQRLFSITCSINALDHARDPLEVIRQMAAVTATNGYVFLRHAENEGIRERYRGLHQWNFSISKGLPTLSDGVTITSLAEAIPALRLISAVREMEKETRHVVFLFQRV